MGISSFPSSSSILHFLKGASALGVALFATRYEKDIPELEHQIKTLSSPEITPTLRQAYGDDSFIGILNTVLILIRSAKISTALSLKFDTIMRSKNDLDIFERQSHDYLLKAEITYQMVSFRDWERARLSRTQKLNKLSSFKKDLQLLKEEIQAFKRSLETASSTYKQQKEDTERFFSALSAIPSLQSLTDPLEDSRRPLDLDTTFEGILSLDETISSQLTRIEDVITKTRSDLSKRFVDVCTFSVIPQQKDRDALNTKIQQALDDSEKEDIVESLLEQYGIGRGSGEGPELHFNSEDTSDREGLTTDTTSYVTNNVFKTNIFIPEDSILGNAEIDIDPSLMDLKISLVLCHEDNHRYQKRVLGYINLKELEEGYSGNPTLRHIRELATQEQHIFEAMAYDSELRNIRLFNKTYGSTLSTKQKKSLKALYRQSNARKHIEIQSLPSNLQKLASENKFILCLDRIHQKIPKTYLSRVFNDANSDGTLTEINA